MSRADKFNYKTEEKVEEDLNKTKAMMEKSDFERMLIKDEEVLEKGCVKELSVFELQSQVEEFEEVKVKIEPKVLEDNPYPVELVTLTCQPDLDIKQDPESDEMEMLQWIYDNEGKAMTFMANQLQTKMVTEPIEEDEKAPMENKEIKQQNEEVDLLEPSEKARKLVEMVKTSLQEKDKVAVPNIINRLQEKLILLLPAVPCQTIPEQVNLENRSFFNYVIRLSDQIRLCDFKLTDGLVSSTSAKLADRASKVLLPKSPARDPEVNSDHQKVLLNDSEILSLRADNEASLLNESEMLSLPADNELQCKWKDCYQTYDSQGALVKHIENNHVQSQSSKEFICFWDNCPRKSKPFYKKGHLLLHMRSHSGEKPYKCGFQGCNKAFRQVRNLTVHQRGHTGEKPYQCQYSNCFKRFSTVYDKNDHQRLHYNPEFYACQVTGCLKKYNHPSNLWRHLKIHTVDEQLETKRKLIENKKKEGDFVLKKSSNSSDRNKHRRMHSNKEAYACRVTGCSKMYADLNSLQKHMENHTVDEELEVKQKSVKKEQMENDFIVYHL